MIQCHPPCQLRSNLESKKKQTVQSGNWQQGRINVQAEMECKSSRVHPVEQDEKMAEEGIFLRKGGADSGFLLEYIAWFNVAASVEVN